MSFIADSEKSGRDIFGRYGTAGGSSFKLRMAPMIDMIFLLLIFFLVTANWRPEEDFLGIQLDSSVVGGKVRLGLVEPLVVRVSAATNGCKVCIGGGDFLLVEDSDIEGGLAVVADELRDCLARQKRVLSDPVELVSDGDVKWDYFAKIYNLFCGVGVTDLTLPIAELDDGGIE